MLYLKEKLPLVSENDKDVVHLLLSRRRMGEVVDFADLTYWQKPVLSRFRTGRTDKIELEVIPPATKVRDYARLRLSAKVEGGRALSASMRSMFYLIRLTLNLE